MENDGKRAAPMPVNNREISQKGFSGSRGLVIRWATGQRKLLPLETRYRRQQPKAVKPALSRQVQPAPWSAPRVAG